MRKILPGTSTACLLLLWVGGIPGIRTVYGVLYSCCRQRYILMYTEYVDSTLQQDFGQQQQHHLEYVAYLLYGRLANKNPTPDPAM